MQAERGASIHLDIPFYRQHYDFTCGPASLMMAMKYPDNDMHLETGLEIDIWREANLVAVPGTSRYGLAYSAVVRGFSARVTSNTGGIDFVDRLVPPLNDQDMQVLKGLFSERRTRCRKLGVREREETITEKNHLQISFSESCTVDRDKLSVLQQRGPASLGHCYRNR